MDAASLILSTIPEPGSRPRRLRSKWATGRTLKDSTLQFHKTSRNHQEAARILGNSESISSGFSVLAGAEPVDDNHGLVTDHPCIVTAGERGDIAWPRNKL